MDDQTNREYSRAPELEDLISLCKSLNREKVEYILIGGFAVILEGFVRVTKEIDLLVDSSIENIQKLKKALSYLPDQAIQLIKDDEVKNYTVVRVADEIVIDLMPQACGIDYATVKETMRFFSVEGIQIPVPSTKMLIRLKNTRRPSDLMDIEFLKISLEEKKKLQK